MTPDSNRSLVPIEVIERRIYLLSGHRVMLDEHLADLYGVATKALNQAVTRNRQRFPDDFAFRLNSHEHAALRSQSVTSKPSRGGRRYPPRAFTEHGILMLSSVLRSQRAVQVNIAIMRTLVRLREMLASNKVLARKLAALELKHDARFGIIFDTLRKLMAPEPCAKRPIGFTHRKS